MTDLAILFGLAQHLHQGTLLLRHASQSRRRILDERMADFVAVNRVSYVTLLRAAGIVEGLYASSTVGVGQFCTNPGLIVLQRSAAAVKRFVIQIGPGPPSAW